MRSILLILLLISCTKTLTPRYIEPLEAFGQSRNDFATIIDLREKEDIKDGIIAQPASWYPLSSIVNQDPQWTHFLKNHKKDKMLIFYCKKGVQCKNVAKMLAEKGYQAGFLGSFEDWLGANLPVKNLEATP